MAPRSKRKLRVKFNVVTRYYSPSRRWKYLIVGPHVYPGFGWSGRDQSKFFGVGRPTEIYSILPLQRQTKVGGDVYPSPNQLSHQPIPSSILSHDTPTLFRSCVLNDKIKTGLKMRQNVCVVTNGSDNISRFIPYMLNKKSRRRAQEVKVLVFF